MKVLTEDRRMCFWLLGERNAYHFYCWPAVLSKNIVLQTIQNQTLYLMLSSVEMLANYMKLMKSFKVLQFENNSIGFSYEN